ncbi:MAG: NUDIX hydrolase [Bdellovibrionales bacterium]|nr:NUDIX hydrolase [Bdellovibrionales bacterium]MBL7686780.1 NUDIX hydrolase [Pseudobdellovibrionaceae bacterium]
MEWKTLESKELLQVGLFRLRQDRCQMPDGRVMPRYYVMEFPDWVNIVPVTHDNKIVMVEQYRHASGRVHLELPGGSTEPHIVEDPKRGALRELIEETGYVPDDIRLVGKHFPNPSMQNNAMWTFIGFGCRKQGEPTPDPYEDLKVVELTVSEVYQKIQSGEIDHSIVVASLHYAMSFLGIR